MNPDRVVTARELAGLKLVEADWLIKNLITRASVNLLSAGPGFGKTYLSLQMGFCVAEGQPFLEAFPPVKKGRVLIYELEQALEEYSTRVLQYDWKDGP